MESQKCWLLVVEHEGVRALIISLRGALVPAYDQPRSQGGGFVELRAAATSKRLAVVVPLNDQIDQRFAGPHVESWLDTLETTPDQWQEFELDALPLKQLIGVG